MCPRSIWEPCPKLQIIESGPKAEGSLSTWGKVINTLKSLLEQKESFDRAEVCSVCHFAWSCFDYSGYCMGWLNSPVSTPFAWKMTSNQNYHILTDGKQWYSRFCKNLKLFFVFGWMLRSILSPLLCTKVGWNREILRFDLAHTYWAKPNRTVQRDPMAP